MAPDLHHLLELLKVHFPWLAPLLFWMGCSRAIIKTFSAPLQKFLTAVMIEASVDNFDVYRLLHNHWYRLTAFILDYLLSFKLPSAQITFMPAAPAPARPVVAVLCFLCLLLLNSGCAALKYSTVPGPSQFQIPTNHGLIKTSTQQRFALLTSQRLLPPADSSGILPPAGSSARVYVLHFRYGPDFPTNTHNWFVCATSNLHDWFLYPDTCYQFDGPDLYLTNDHPQMFFRIWNPS